MLAYLRGGLPDVRYWLADAEKRQQLDTEKLQAGYRRESQALEANLRENLAKDKEVSAKLKDLKDLVFSYRKKCVDLLDGLNSSLNSSLLAHARPTVAPDMISKVALPESTFHDGLLVKEVRVDSVSDHPTTLLTDEHDLLRRYHADVSVTLSFVMGNGHSVPTPLTLEATATPEKRWTFPTYQDVKSQIASVIEQSMSAIRADGDLALDKIKLELETALHKQEYEFEQRELREKYQHRPP